MFDRINKINRMNQKKILLILSNPIFFVSTPQNTIAIVYDYDQRLARVTCRMKWFSLPSGSTEGISGVVAQSWFGTADPSAHVVRADGGRDREPNRRLATLCG
jgi:hypothetical protein